jgi:hypothetical protein
MRSSQKWSNKNLIIGPAPSRPVNYSKGSMQSLPIQHNSRKDEDWIRLAHKSMEDISKHQSRLISFIAHKNEQASNQNTTTLQQSCFYTSK